MNENHNLKDYVRNLPYPQKKKKHNERKMLLSSLKGFSFLGAQKKKKTFFYF